LGAFLADDALANVVRIWSTIATWELEHESAR